jgi:hypothetical protein
MKYIIHRKVDKMELQERLKLLPQWAQNEFKYLQREIETLKGDIAGMKGEVQDWAVFVKLGYKREYPIPQEATVNMRGFEFSIQDNRIRIVGVQSHRGDMVIIPQISNVVFLDYIEK